MIGIACLGKFYYKYGAIRGIITSYACPILLPHCPMNTDETVYGRPKPTWITQTAPPVQTM